MVVRNNQKKNDSTSLYSVKHLLLHYYVKIHNRNLLPGCHQNKYCRLFVVFVQFPLTLSQHFTLLERKLKSDSSDSQAIFLQTIKIYNFHSSFGKYFNDIFLCLCKLNEVVMFCAPQTNAFNFKREQKMSQCDGANQNNMPNARTTKL